LKRRCYIWADKFWQLIIVRPQRMWRRIFRILGIFIFLLAARHSFAQVVDHAFGFDMRYDDQDAEVLDYRYGNSKLPVQAPESAVLDGKPLVSANGNGPMLRGEFLYVKWRNKGTGQLFEDNVDLRHRLPTDITGYRVQFIIKGPQLYVYLISPQLRPPDFPANGPKMYHYKKTTVIYPDQPKQ
jgi:hypothetical protein